MKSDQKIADVGDKGAQKGLSVKRAQAVADYLVRKGAAKNRRVEITLLR